MSHLNMYLISGRLCLQLLHARFRISICLRTSLSQTVVRDIHQNFFGHPVNEYQIYFQCYGRCQSPCLVWNSQRNCCRQIMYGQTEDGKKRRYEGTQCFKITKNVAFEFFQKLAKLTIFDQIVNVARFARNFECDFFCYFQTQ